jgi:CDP-diacylglycerol--serine O-phosphatidyltransferase
MPVVLFSVYLLYGMIRPWISQKMRKEIEVESETEEDAEASPAERPKPEE